MKDTDRFAELADIVGPENCRRDSSTLETYGRDWTKHFVPCPSAVVFPQTTASTQEIVHWARRHRIPLVPSGGRTGLSAAAYATNGEVVVSFEKMKRILDYNPVDQVVTCEAGVITQVLQEFAKGQGLYFPVDFAARGSSQIGGNVATNAGGIKVLRYGLMRQWVSGLKVVTGGGDILELNRSLVKNATGYDLRHLMIGSEGTLALITEVSLGLTRPPKNLTVFVLGLPELTAVMQVFDLFRRQLPLTAYEMWTELAQRYVTADHRVPRPFATECPYYALVEFEAEDENTLDLALSLFEQGVEQGWILDGSVSQNPDQAADLWRLREDITEATSHREPYKNDVSVRISQVPAFLTEMDAILQKEHPTFEVVWFGHIGDGNLHINILKPPDISSAEFVKRCKQVDTVLFSMIRRLGGSISAEHGVGLVKKPFLQHTRSAAEVRLMQEIKRAFDPDGILNPGKIF